MIGHDSSLTGGLIGILNLADVRLAILETNGEISFFADPDPLGRPDGGQR